MTRGFAWMRTIPEPVPLILTGTVGRIGDDLLRGADDEATRLRRGRRQGMATIPAFTAPGDPVEEFKDPDCKTIARKRRVGKLRRQCTREYKVEVVERIIRRTIFKLKPRQRFPKGTRSVQIFGISTDERHRAKRISARVNATGWAVAEFPLLDLRMSRDDCIEWLKPRVPHETPESSCVFCPFKDAASWLATKKDPEAWARAVEVDAGLRKPGAIAQRGMNQPIYIHRTAVPLPLVDFEAEAVKERARKRRPLFDVFECGEGMCGN